MAEAGYNPVEMARFFQKLDEQDGQGRSIEFLSDHPHPGNRLKAVEEQIAQMPRRTYTTDTRQFARIQDVVSHLPAPGRLRGKYDDGHAPAAPDVRPSSRLKQYQGREFAFTYPENWQTFGDSQSAMVAVAPSDGVIRDGSGNVSIGYGAIVSYYFPQSDEIEMRRNKDNLKAETADLIRQFEQTNAGLSARESRTLRVDGHAALITTLRSRSPYQGETEVDLLVTVIRPEGLWYMVLISPESESQQAQPVFDRMVGSIRFPK
jgi:predicted Zn-dependent protease